MRQRKKIAVIIPCHNEETGVVRVIGDIPAKRLAQLGFNIKIYVVDNNSFDRTSEVAKKLKAHVVFEKKIGKGNAIKRGLESLPKNTDYVVIIDGDNTYKASEIPRLLEPLESGFADMIAGSRLSGRINKKSLTTEHKIVNWIFTFLIRHFYKVNTTDVLSGYIAVKYKVTDDLIKVLKSRGFEIEMEINIKASRMGYKIFSVPITYDIRSGESKLEGFKDAIAIFFTFLRYLTWNLKKQKLI